MAFPAPELRTATPADLPLIATWLRTATECAMWAGPRLRFPIDPHSLWLDIDVGNSDAFTLTLDRERVAFGQLFSKAGHRGHLARVIVAPPFRGRGYGERLVQELLARCRAKKHVTASLNVDPANAAAIALYTKLGFRGTQRPADEPDPTGSRYMELSLR